MRRPLATVLAAGIAVSVDAHEFWIEPLQWQVAPGTPIIAHLRVGEDFDGPPSPYRPSQFTRFEAVLGDVAVPIDGRIGDIPALSQIVPAPGLAILVHATTDFRLTYDDLEDFAAFARSKGYDEAVALHRENGWPRAGFDEFYRRYAKSLVAVGAGVGTDRAIGLQAEIVARANPYTDDLAEGLPIEVRHQDAPRAGVQVDIFARASDGTVSQSTGISDAEGRVTVPVRPGHTYLLDSVLLRTRDGPDALWESLWASLTFRVPDR